MQLDEGTLPYLARGCAVLGAGGGGSSRVGLMAALQAIEDYGPVELVDLDDLADDALIMPCGMVGAPTVSIEKLSNGSEGVWIRRRIEELTGRKVAAIMATEIGGSNGCEPVAWAARMGLPVVDADGMGRAFPEMPQVAMHVAGIRPDPCVLTDERGNVSVLYPTSGLWLERLCRSSAVAFGGRAVTSEYLMTASEARTATVRGSVSLALQIGRLLTSPDGEPVEELLSLVNGARLIDGKIVDVDRRTTGGFVRGSVVIEGLRNDAGRLLRIEIQNENLVALEDGSVRASVPDIITVLDTQTAEAITTELLRYGQRVTVVAFPCAPIWRTDKGLEMAGPRAFGYDFDYVTIERIHSGIA
jgi:uncharacterized protein